jgi:TolB protein
MKNILLHISFLLFFIFPSFFIFGNEELEVALSTKPSLTKVYLSKFYDRKSLLSSEYLYKIEEVLKFDLNHSGVISVHEREINKDILLSNFKTELAFDHKSWHDHPSKFVIKSWVEEKKLFVNIYEIQNQNVRNFSPVVLSGDLSSDRKKIHQISESIQQIYFDKLGIANLRILYTVRVEDKQSQGPKWISEVWTSDYDGENARQLTFENNYCVHPLFVPSVLDKSKETFLYVSYKTGQSKIYASKFNKTESNRVVFLRGNQLLPSLSKQSDKMAFISDAAGRADLFLQHFDEKGMLKGKPRQIFSFPRSTQASPCFSPDGKKIAFVSDKDGPPRIYVLEIDLRKRKKLPKVKLITKKNRQNVSPSWSDDGTKLAYSAKTDNVRQIWIYDFELDEERQLTFGTENKENPAWAPDGIHLMYNTEDVSSAEIYLISINQKEPVKISKGFGKKRFPAWQSW